MGELDYQTPYPLAKDFHGAMRDNKSEFNRILVEEIRPSIQLMGGKKYRNGFEYTLNSETLRWSLEKIKESDIERAGDVYSNKEAKIPL